MENNVAPKTIAKYFLTKEAMTQKKIQKMVYYAYAWYIVNYNDNANNITYVLFTEKPQAWVHGPVFPSLYEEYKQYKRNNVPKIKNSILEKTELSEFLNQIWDVFGKYDGDELEFMTHNEKPWINARKGIPAISPSNEEIDLKDIYNYYGSL